MRFINTNKKSEGSEAVSSLSETISFICGGSAKGNATECFTWVADFLFKSPENTKINPHIAYISFFSDKEIMYEEFGNVNRINENYSFFNSVLRQKLTPDSFELTRKQYTSVSNKKADFDVIEYVNYSDIKKYKWLEFSYPDINYSHKYWRAPNFITTGYRIHLDESVTPMDNFDKYYWCYGWDNTSKLQLNNSILQVPVFGSDFTSDNDGGDKILEHYPSAFSSENVNVRQLIDSKINVSNAKYAYFENKSEWVYYYNDTVHYYEQSYSPYYGIVNHYSNGTDTNPDWVSMSPVIESGNKVLFFPAIIRNNVLEPAKIISNWSSDRSGQVTFNNGVHLGQPDDQSRLVYNICRYMIDENSTVSKDDDSGIHLYGGIDVDTERNRRYSSVVMTEPYFVTAPICGGEVVGYSFINSSNKPIKGVQDFSTENPDMFLKIKATKNVIDEIDRILNERDYNTDIIETISINNPAALDRRLYFIEQDYYKNFYNIIDRQEDCSDDLIGNDSVKRGIVGEGTHVVFTIPDFNETGKYSDDLKKVNGFGFVSKTIKDSNGNIIGTTNFLNMYCSNYTPKNSPDKDMNSINNETVSLLVDPESASDLVEGIHENELFRPMVKLPGINGYIKIIERNTHFKVTRSNDGLYEVVYNVEFPFCPGSYNERLAMDFTSQQYKETVILNKLSYINTGSWEKGDDNTYDISNDRYVPFADDSFCSHSVLTQYIGVENVVTNSFLIGGGIKEISSSNKNTVEYPEGLVWSTSPYYRLALLKPRHLNYRRFGTYDIKLPYAVSDKKLFCLVDNRQWNFAKDNYISYINKENPSYVCEIDLSTLFKNFSDLQSLNASLPDLKRWIYSFFSGFAHTALDADTAMLDTDEGNEDKIVTEKINTFGNVDISTAESQSDIVIEMWDHTLNNWNPMSFMSNNSKKVNGKLIIDNVNISNLTGDTNDGIINVTGDIYTVAIGYIDELGGLKFPQFVNFEEPDDILKYRSNLVLYDSRLMRTYHIIYIEPYAGSSGDPRQLYRAYIYYDPTEAVLPETDPEDVDLNNRGYLSIYEPKKQINKDTSFELYANQVVQGIEGNIIVRFLDIRTLYTTTPAPSKIDSERYIDNNKMYFRIRVIKKKNYSVSFENDDESIIQYNGIDITDPTKRLWMNFPWTSDNGATFDQEFDWQKIKTTEILRKFGMSYFKCASK